MKYGVAIILLCWSMLAEAQTTFNFTLTQPCDTSAGVFNGTNGQLLATLWSKFHYYTAGNYSGSWNGLDQFGNTVPTGTPIQIRILQGNVQPTWQGAIGNTSAAQAGQNVFSSFYFIQGMCSGGGTNFFDAGYNEGHASLFSFKTNSPTVLDAHWFTYINQFGQTVGGSGGANLSWNFMASDGNWVYAACSATYNPTNNTPYASAGCIVAYQINGYSVANFTSGGVITNGPGLSFPNGIFAGTQPGLSGLAVQVNGPYLAASSFNDGKVYIDGKQTGSQSNVITVANPLGLSFGRDSNLWVVASNSSTHLNQLLLYTNVGTSATLLSTFTTFSNVLAVAASASNQNVALVADGAGAQQVYGINEAGSILWTLGTKGGMPTNGVAVNNNTFDFVYLGVPQTFLCAESDGSFWVGDPINDRALHFDTNQNYLEQVMYQERSYCMAAEAQNPTHVYSNGREFSVTYPASGPPQWTFTTNWIVNCPTNLYNDAQASYPPFQPVTLSNGRTYAMGLDWSLQFSPRELIEMTNTGIRSTGIYPFSNQWANMDSNGTIYGIPQGNAIWSNAALTGFSGVNPTWGATNLLATARSLAIDPVPRCCVGNQLTVTTTNNVLLSFDSTLSGAAYHFGGVQLGAGSTNWLWETSFSSTGMNGLGLYPTNITGIGAGEFALALDNFALFWYNGEGYSQGQAAQGYLYTDDGLFITQFGESSSGYSGGLQGTIPAFAGNAQQPNFVKYNGKHYVWVNDESAHGPQLWHLAGLSDVFEATGSGSINTTITVTNPAKSLPATAVPLSFNPTNRALFLGALVEGNVNSSIDDIGQNVYTGATFPGLIGSEHVSGVLAPSDLVNYGFGFLPVTTVGASGAYVWNWGGYGVNYSNGLAAFTVTNTGGWQNVFGAVKSYRINGTLGTNCALTANTSGSIAIGVTDTNAHILTVVCPSLTSNPRSFSVSVASPNGQTATFTTNENGFFGSFGWNYTLQFLITGNVTVTASASAANYANLVAMFFDPVPTSQVVNIISAVGNPVTIISSPTAPVTIIAQ